MSEPSTNAKSGAPNERGPRLKEQHDLTTKSTDSRLPNWAHASVLWRKYCRRWASIPDLQDEGLQIVAFVEDLPIHLEPGERIRTTSRDRALVASYIKWRDQGGDQ